MKYIFTSICLGLALMFTASAQNIPQGDIGNATTTVHRGSTRASAVTAPTATTTRRMVQPTTTTQRSISSAPFRQRTRVTTPSVNANATVRSGTTANARLRERHANATVHSATTANARLRERRSNATVRSATTANARVRSNVGLNRERNTSVNRTRNVSVNAGANATVNRNRNVTVTNNWRSGQFSGRQYAAFRNYHRTWHDRAWWTSHYNRIAFVSGGWWYWNAGYWYPAWGYASDAYYPYDGPIYGYSDLAPDQVVTQVQLQLQRDGYYAGPVDGVLGPMTRQAIAAFQADHGLAITSTVDEPTLSTLGLS